MTEPTGRPVPVATAPRSRLRGFLAAFAPRWFGVSAPSAGSDVSPARADASPHRSVDSSQGAPTVSASTTTRERWRGSRVTLPLLAFIGSSTGVAWAFRTFYSGPMLPRSVFAVGSVVWLAAAAVARLRAKHDRVREGVVIERRGPRLDYVLTWIALLWAFLAML